MKYESDFDRDLDSAITRFIWPRLIACVVVGLFVLGGIVARIII